MKKLLKTPSGIHGLDEITDGGFPASRTTLVCGGPGCGKTLFSICFIVNGALQYKEPGVFVAFEERTDELAANVASLGVDLEKLQKSGKILVDHVQIHRSEIDETGEYDLEGLFIRLDHAIKSIGAKRVVLDTIENLFSGLNNQAIIRAELIRLFQWLKDRGVTAMITAEKGDGILTRHGLEEYVSDCVILLDNRVINQISTRRLRIIKYRGSFHGTNEYPFLIDAEGISVLPVTSLRLERDVSKVRISSGIPDLDAMLSGKGFYRGSSILISGTSGTGKTSIAAHFIKAGCDRKERSLFFAFEESPGQIMRNMSSIGLDMRSEEKKGFLKFQSAHPTESGLEMHLVRIYKTVRDFKPKIVVIDPITNLITIGDMREVKSMLMRLLDMLQSEGITVMFTALTTYSASGDRIDESISSLVDTWIQVQEIENDGERNRGLYIMKSRGMAHSNQVREFLISSSGLQLVDIYLGPQGVLTGSARMQAQKLQLKDDQDLKASEDRARWAKNRQGQSKRKTELKK
jgi:circadian clock protein KaiC